MVLRVVEQARRQFTGTFGQQFGQSVVWLDGVTVGSPVLVGDVRGLPVAPEDKVVVELVQFPDGLRQGEGVIMEILGSSKNPAIDTLAVMRQFGLEDHFPDEVIQAARQQADQFTEGHIPDDRRDLTQVPTLTIDPVDARDFDDAISLSRNEKGHWELMVHIADVAHFVPIGSQLDEEAKKRATSVYLPDRVIPMLPEIISNHLASLQPNRTRLTKIAVLMEMSETGTLLHQEVFNSAIHNHQRLNYEQVDQYLEDPEPWRGVTAPIWQLLSDMHCGHDLARNRVADGSYRIASARGQNRLGSVRQSQGQELLSTESHQIIRRVHVGGQSIRGNLAG